MPASWRVRVVEETGSTNDDLAAQARAGAPGRSVLVARHQTAGRGRLDRRWDAPSGANLLVSILLRGVAQPMQRVSLAALDAARRAGADASLKWPNDVMIGDRKLAGVLAQAGTDGGGWVVVGVGMNVGWAPPEAAMLGAEHDPLAVLADLLAALDRLDLDGEDVTAAHRGALATIGRQVRVELAEGPIVGEAVDVTDDGALVVRVDGVDRVIRVGDVVHLRDAGGARH